MKIITHAWNILNKKQKGRYILLFFIQFVGALFELMGVAALLPLLQLLLMPEKLMNNKYIVYVMQCLNITSEQKVIVFIIGSIIVVYVVKNLYLIWMTYIRYRIVWNSQSEVEKDMMQYYVSQPYEYYTYSNPSVMQRVILTDVGNVFRTIENVLVLLSDVITLAFILIFLLITDVYTTSILILLLTLFMLLYFKVFKNRLYEYGKIMQAKGGEVSRSIYNVFHCVKEIKVYGREGYFIKSFSQSRDQQISMMKRSAFCPQVPKYVMEMICVDGVLMLLLLRVAGGGDIRILATQMGMFVAASYRLLPAVNRINIGMSTITTNKASIELAYALRQEIRQQIQNKVIDDVAESRTEKQDIVFEHVSFRYKNTDDFILKDVSFTIQAGQSVGFIGASGAGKTTTVDLLLGILKPTEGRILYGGKDIEYLGKRWSSHLGYIPQTIYLSDDTLRVNVAFGIENPEDEKIWNALREAQLYDFVKESELGLDSTMGEGGIRFSGGQRQRVGIARALYHDPDILVLDEATSALDNDTEKAVMESINYLQGRKTLIIIAHRLSTIENCDVVFEVKDGKVMERKR